MFGNTFIPIKEMLLSSIPFTIAQTDWYNKLRAEELDYNQDNKNTNDIPQLHIAPSGTNVPAITKDGARTTAKTLNNTNLSVKVDIPLTFYIKYTETTVQTTQAKDKTAEPQPKTDAQTAQGSKPPKWYEFKASGEIYPSLLIIEQLINFCEILTANGVKALQNIVQKNGVSKSDAQQNLTKYILYDLSQRTSATQTRFADVIKNHHFNLNNVSISAFTAGKYDEKYLSSLCKLLEKPPTASVEIQTAQRKFNEKNFIIKTNDANGLLINTFLSAWDQKKNNFVINDPNSQNSISNLLPKLTGAAYDAYSILSSIATEKASGDISAAITR